MKIFVWNQAYGALSIILHIRFGKGGPKVVILLFVAVKVTHKKRVEFEQTMESLMDDLRSAGGCLDYCIYCDYKDPVFFSITSKWKTKQHFFNHTETDSFGILCGAIANLCVEDQVEITLTVSSEELLEVELALKKQLSNSVQVKSKMDKSISYT